jgi:hypothetical protein
MSGAGSRLFAEGLKLRRPMTVVCSIAVVLVIAFQVIAFQRAADERFRSLTAPGSTCAGKTERECFPLVELRAAFPAVGLQRDPVGVLGVAAGFIASLPGAIGLLAVAAAFVSGEWERGSIAAVFGRNPDRGAFVVTKFAILWLLGMAWLVTAYAALVALVPVLNALYEAQAIESGVDVLGFSLVRLGKATVVLAAYSAIGTAFGVLVRSPLASLASSVAFLSLGIGIARVWPISFGYWVAQWMSYDRNDFGGSHLWPVHAAGARLIEELVAPMGLAACLVFAGLAAMVLRRASV